MKQVVAICDNEGSEKKHYAAYTVHVEGAPPEDDQDTCPKHLYMLLNEKLELADRVIISRVGAALPEPRQAKSWKPRGGDEHCTVPGCSDNEGKGFVSKHAISMHTRRAHGEMQGNPASIRERNGHSNGTKPVRTAKRAKPVRKAPVRRSTARRR